MAEISEKAAVAARKPGPSEARRTNAASERRAGSGRAAEASDKARRDAARRRSGGGRRPDTIAPRRVVDASGDDLFLEKRDAAAKARKGNGGRRRHAKKRSSAAYIALNLFFLAGILSLLAVGSRQVRQHEDFLRMKTAVERQTFYNGTTVEGIDISGMTLADAMSYWQDSVEPRYAQRAVTLDNGDTLTAWDLGYSSDYASVLAGAWSAGRSGSLEQRYRALTQRASDPVAYAVHRVMYSEDAVEQYVRSAAALIDQPAKDAAISAFDAASYKYEISPEQTGAKLDTEALRNSIIQTLDAGGGSVSLVVRAVQPQVKATDVASQYGLIAYAITNASSSSNDRLNNIELAMRLINGTCVKAGETFSFNAAVGERTTSRGFKMATAYSGGEVTEQVGGGICQVSTTLFNAAVKADLKVVERHSHSLTVSYVDKGKDATVNWGSQDLRFENTSGDDIYICCYLTDDKRVRFGIFGRLLPNGEKITVEAETVETIKYETEYQLSSALLPGQMYETQKGRDGYVAEAYKIRWDADGNRLSRELLCKSYYKKVNQIVLYGQ